MNRLFIILVLALVVLSCKDNDTIYLVELPNPNGDTIIVGNDTIVNGDTISSNGNDNTLECKDPVIGIELLVAEPVDAKFYAIGRRLVLVCQNPNKLIRYDVHQKVLIEMDLPSTPTSLDISDNGELALVGFDGAISYVNLLSMSIIKSINVSCRTYDVVLGRNNWAYVYPADGQWEYVRCIDLDTEEEVLSQGNFVRETTSAEKHPTMDVIYGANNGVSPSDIERMDISSDTAVYAYDSPYHGDYAFSGALWISESGESIYTRGKTVVSSDPLESKDMVYKGSLQTEAREVFWAHDSESENIVAAVVGDRAYVDGEYRQVPTESIEIYNLPLFSSAKQVEMPDIETPETCFNTRPKFCFIWPAGDELVVVVNAYSDKTLIPSNWAILNLPL